MKEIVLVCNAHLDPVWLWRWQEGAGEALSTFRTAADFCEEFDGFVFNHNEALLYEWVENTIRNYSKGSGGLRIRESGILWEAGICSRTA